MNRLLNYLVTQFKKGFSELIKTVFTQLTQNDVVDKDNTKFIICHVNWLMSVKSENSHSSENPVCKKLD